MLKWKTRFGKTILAPSIPAMGVISVYSTLNHGPISNIQYFWAFVILWWCFFIAQPDECSCKK